MTNPLDVLPFIDGDTYTFENQVLRNRAIEPGNEERVQISGVDRGYYFGSTTVIQGEGGEKTEITIKVDDFVADTSIKQLFDSGFVSPQGITPGISRYDTDNNIFTAIHNPQRTIPFNDKVIFSQKATNTSDRLRAETSIFSIGIINEERFVRQYLEFTSPQLAVTDRIDEMVERITQ